MLPEPSPEVVALGVEGRKIDAVKRYRAETGAGLREAVRAVDPLSAAPMRQTAWRTEPGPSPAERRKQTAGLAAVAVALGAFGIAIAGFKFVYAWPARTWPATVGTIVEARFVDGFRNDRFDVAFTYTVDGDTYRGDRIRLASLSDDTIVRAQRARYPEGARVDVYYDPQAPERAVLEREIPAFYAGWFALSLPLVAGGLHVRRRILSAGCPPSSRP